MLRKVWKSLTHNKRNTLPLVSVVASMLICALCFTGATWAWFSVVYDSPMEAISSAVTYASISNNGNQKLIAPAGFDGVMLMSESAADKSYVFAATPNVPYVLEINLQGSSLSSYVTIDTPEGNYYTMDRSTNVTVLLSQPGTVTVSLHWGTVAEGERMLLNASQIGIGVVDPNAAANGGTPADPSLMMPPSGGDAILAGNTDETTAEETDSVQIEPVTDSETERGESDEESEQETVIENPIAEPKSSETAEGNANGNPIAEAMQQEPAAPSEDEGVQE